jgi:hypothetical protein
VGADVMGYVVENRLTVAALHQRLSSSSSVQMMMPASIASAHLPPYTPVAQASKPASWVDDAAELGVQLCLAEHYAQCMVHASPCHPNCN